MKQVAKYKPVILKGVSTLDVLKKNAKVVLLLLMITTLSGAIYGGHSILDRIDPSFDPQIETNSFGTKQIYAIASLPDDKILVAGYFTSYNRQPVGGLVRLNADGTLDTTFNNTLFETESRPNAIILQTDGKIIVKGVNLTVNGHTTPDISIIRLNSNGTIDSTFNYSGGGVISSVAVDSSNRILLSGNFLVNNVAQRLIRLNSDGSVDTTFQYISDKTVLHIAVQNNKIIIITSLSEQVIVERLNQDGTQDTSFTSKVIASPLGIIVQPDKKILVLDYNKLQRLNENGGNDATFTESNFVPNQPRQMALSNNGKITLSLYLDGLGLVEIKKFLSNGITDNSFTPYAINSGVYGNFGLQSNDSVIIGDVNFGGNGTTISNYFSRLLPSGSFDTSFNTGGIGFQRINPGSTRAIAFQPDGKIIIGGKFDSVNNSPHFKIARLNSDSTIDPTFQINISGTGNYFSQIYEIYNVVVQSDGKLLVSGNFIYLINGETKSHIVRLNSDGSIDPTFNLAVLINTFFTCCAGGTNKIGALSNGKLIIGTSRITSTQVPVPLKLNADGTVDNSFNPNIYTTQQSVYIKDLTIQPNGKIIIGGTYRISNINFITDKSFIARLNADGSTDQTFQISEETDKEISALSLLPNGKILIVKNTFNTPVQQSDVLRLNSDGSIDNSFNAGTSANGKLNVILALPTGKIFVGGKFSSFNGQMRQNLAQLNADGSLNPTTYTLNDEVLSLAVDSAGRVLVGGNFTVINANGGSANRSYIARLIDSIQAKRTRFDFDGDGRADVSVFRASEGKWFINRSSDGFTGVTFGAPTDRIVPADYDGDGKTDVAVFRDGFWYILKSTTGFAAVHFGESMDIPQPADFDGDGKDDVAVFRPSNGTWYVLGSQNGFFAAQFGKNGDKPIAADFDGDARADFAVFRDGYWYIQNTTDGFKAAQFGFGTDIPVAADYDGDGKTEIAVFREGFWYMLESGGGFRGLQFGSSTDLPIPADYDGDGKTDIAVSRGGFWYMLKSSNSSFYSELFGFSTDKPIPSAFR